MGFRRFQGDLIMGWGQPALPGQDQMPAPDANPLGVLANVGPLAGATQTMQPVPVNAAIAHALRPSFFGQGGTGRTIAGMIGDALLSASGHQPIYAPMMQRQQEQSREEQRYENRLRLQQQMERNQPFHTADADGNVVQIDPGTGTSRILYHGAPHLTGIAAEIADLKNNGATPEQIQTFISNKVDPVRMAAQTDAASGQTTLTPYRSSQFGQPAAAPPRVLTTLPPGAVPVSDGGPTPSGSGTFPRPRR